MHGAKKVIWKEGLFLQPQHFQLSERFLFNTINARFSSYIPHYFGFTNYALNKDAIANGTFSVTQAEGIMPDGTAFDIPKQDNVPPSRPFEEHFTHEQQTLDIFFSLPMAAEKKANVGSSPDSNETVRYRSNVVSFSDEVLGKQQKEIEIGDFNYKILFGDESRDNYSYMQVARLIRTGSGEIEVDETYVPPLLQLGGSQILLDKMRSLLELLLAKNSSLSQGRKQLEGGFAEFSSAEDTTFRLLHTLNTYTPLLNYYHFVPDVHPYTLFSQLIQFTGALCTFSSEVSIKMLPRYEHSNILSVLTRFDAMIRKILGADISAGCVNIPIEEISPASYLCNVTDEKLFSTGEFYFGVAADISDKELVVGTLSRIKMCSRDKLELIIPSAMPGLPLKHVSQPPEGLSVKPGFIYFKLDQQGDFWEGIKTSGTIAFYFPHQYSNLRMEMLALRS